VFREGEGEIASLFVTVAHTFARVVLGVDGTECSNVLEICGVVQFEVQCLLSMLWVSM
jgi:hypothetical protein